jgi:hypothetical protein
VAMPTSEAGKVVTFADISAIPREAVSRPQKGHRHAYHYRAAREYYECKAEARRIVESAVEARLIQGSKGRDSEGDARWLLR